MNLREYPGYVGAHTRETAPGALASGTRVMKTNSEDEDAHPNGSLGTVLGSMAHPEVMNGLIFYFIEWDARPGIAVGTVSVGTNGPKLRAAS